MIIFKTAKDIIQFVDNQHIEHKKIGFVPTMGALHLGHISLVNDSKVQNDITIVSIFVNPTQFNNPEDFEKYPITTNEDIEKLVAAKCDVLFLPDVKEMYPNGTSVLKHFAIEPLDTILEGKYRPGHFQGVCNIVNQLLLYTKPNNLYMGAKDYQQCMVVNKLIEVEKIPTTLHICPTLRQENGLALSSRNMRLSPLGLEKATTIFKCLNYIKQNINGDYSTVYAYCNQLLLNNLFEPEYIILANAITLQELENFNTNEPMVVLIAAWIDDVRLIDNMIIN